MNKPSLSDLLSLVSNKESLVAFILALSQNETKHNNEWEHASIADYLEAVSTWITDANFQVQSDNPWKSIAEMLYAGKSYE